MGKGILDARAGPVGRPYPLHHVRLEVGVGQRLVETVEHVVDRVGQREAAHSSRVVVDVGIVAERHDLVAPQHLAGGDFLEVVVLPFHPEDRHHRAARLLRPLLGQLERRDCLVDRVEGTGQEPDLLPRHDGNRLRVAKGVHVPLRGGPSAPRLVLLRKHVGQNLAIGRTGGCGLGPSPSFLGRPPVSRIEGGHLLKRSAVVNEQVRKGLQIGGRTSTGGRVNRRGHGGKSRVKRTGRGLYGQ
jgi:hypothetical protein